MTWISGIEGLWSETKGSSEVCVAILDGPVDLEHPSLAAANLTQIGTLLGNLPKTGAATRHGTHVASVILGQEQGDVRGIAPHCRGISIPVFTEGSGQAIAPCSQIDLARAILQAIEGGAHIINISGGQLSESGAAHPLLADAIQKCSLQHVLIVAAVGNDGCSCVHVPAASSTVLAVGAMDEKGDPLGFSNWGDRYATHGILAPGVGVLGASPQGGTVAMTGTSYATAIVSGVAALLLSLQLKYRQKLNVDRVRFALLQTAIGCDEMAGCERLLMGRLNIEGAMFSILRKEPTMNESTEYKKRSEVQITKDDHGSADTRVATLKVDSPPAVAVANTGYALGGKGSTPEAQVNQHNVRSATCECGGGTPMQLVFALGQLGFDFGTEARRDSILQHMSPQANPYDPNQLLSYLEKNPADSAAIHWTLNLDATPIYAVHGQGAFATETYLRLREFLAEQTRGEIERVAIPGYLAGSTVLLSGRTVPIVWPVLRGMYSWNIKALSDAAVSKVRAQNVEPTEEEYTAKNQMVGNFLQRVYEELRNLGITPQERAINYSATNAFQATSAIIDAINREMDLDTIEVARSPICRPESDCWDVKLTFFNPSKVLEQARRVYVWTVDVSDVVPVSVGAVRSWFVH